MTAIEALNKIKAMFAEAGELPAVAPGLALAEYVLMGGAKVNIDKLEVGGKVEVIGEDGSLSPAPVGEHELADGTKIVVDEAGIITSVSVPEAAPSVEVEVEAKVDEEKEMMKKKIQQMEEELSAMKAKFSEVESASVAQSEKFASAITQLTDVVVGLCNTPSVDPLPQADKSYKFVESKQSKIDKFLDMAKNLKK
jgi:hypothetical protein